MNHIGSPTSTIDSPLAATRRQTNTSNSNSNSNNGVYEQPLIRSQVELVRKSVTHFETILSSYIVEGRIRYEIVYDDMSQEEVDLIKLSRRQEIYYKEGKNGVVGQQKQKARSTLDDEYVGTQVTFMHLGVTFYSTMKRYYCGN